MLRETSRLTKTCQNEDKLNSAHGLAIDKALNNNLLRDAMSLVDIDDWSSDKKNTSY